MKMRGEAISNTNGNSSTSISPKEKKEEKKSTEKKVFVIPREQHKYVPFQRHDMTNYFTIHNFFKLLLGKASEVKPDLQENQQNLLPPAHLPSSARLWYLFFKKLVLGPFLFISRLLMIFVLFTLYILYLFVVQACLKVFGINLARNLSENPFLFRVGVKIYLFAFGIYNLKHRVLTEQEFDVIWSNHLKDKVYDPSEATKSSLIEQPPTFRNEERAELQKKIGIEFFGEDSGENIRIQKEAFVTISNHLTIVDPLIIMATQGEELSCLVKEDAQYMPILGWMMNLSNFLFLGPDKELNRTVLPAILVRSILYYHQDLKKPEFKNKAISNYEFFKNRILKAYDENKTKQEPQKKPFEFQTILESFKGCINPEDKKNYLSNEARMKDFLERESILFQRKEIHPKIKRMMVFPEATTISGTHFIDFYKGGFALGTAVKPCIILGSGSFRNLNTTVPLSMEDDKEYNSPKTRYELPNFNQGWVGGYSYFKYLYHFLTELTEEIEVIELPPLIPNEDELRDGLLWAKKVRKIMMETANYMKQMKRFQNAEEYLFLRYEEWLKK